MAGVYVNLRDFNINTTKISYINGCEIVDKKARQDIVNLNSSGVVQMKKAIFKVNEFGDGYEFLYQASENDNQEL
jgi:hypothetical protein